MSTKHIIELSFSTRQTHNINKLDGIRLVYIRLMMQIKSVLLEYARQEANLKIREDYINQECL